MPIQEQTPNRPAIPPMPLANPPTAQTSEVITTPDQGIAVEESAERSPLAKARELLNETPAPTPDPTFYMQGTDFVPRNSMRGVWYLLKCWVARILPWAWEPKAPHDKHYRTFIELADQLIELMKDRRRMMSVLGSKGGVGKTPLATYLAALLAYVTHRRILIVDANHNEGTTGLSLDISRDKRILLLAAIKNPSILDSADQTRESLGFHQESGLWALLSNPNSITENVTMKEFIELLFFLLWRFDSIVTDGGNGIAHSTQNGAAYVCDNLLFPALATKPSSFEIAMSTMLGFYDLGHTQKVRDGLKIVSATGRKATRKEYVEHYRELIYKFASNENDPRGGDDEVQVPNIWYNRGDELMEALGIREENFFLVPTDKHIKEERVVTLKREFVSMPTLIAYMRILVRVFQMSVPDEQEKIKAIDDLFKPSESSDTTVNIPQSKEKLSLSATSVEQIVRQITDSLRGGMTAEIEGQVTRRVQERLHADGYA